MFSLNDFKFKCINLIHWQNVGVDTVQRVDGFRLDKQ